MPKNLINKAALDLIKSFEGIKDGDRSTVNLDPYLDPVGIWTIGWGHAITQAGQFVRGRKNQQLAHSLYPNGITYAEAEDLLRKDIAKHTRELDGLLKVELNENQYGALASFVFNVGARNLAKSSLLKFVNEQMFEEAADQFRVWCKAGGNVLPGLVRRRKAERELFLTPVAKQVLHADEDDPVGSPPSAAPVAPARPAVTAAEQEEQDKQDLLDVAVNSATVKQAAPKLWPRLVGLGTYLFTLYQANQVIGNILVLIVLVAIGVVVYWKWKVIKTQLLKCLKS